MPTIKQITEVNPVQEIFLKSARDSLKVLGSGLLNPFTPKPLTGIKIDQNLHIESQKAKTEMIDTLGELKKQTIRRAANEKIGELSAHFAHLGTVPQAVANRNFEKITAQAMEAIQRVELETSWALYSDNINALQANYSMQNRCMEALNEINMQKNAPASLLFDIVLGNGIDALFR